MVLVVRRRSKIWRPLRFHVSPQQTNEQRKGLMAVDLRRYFYATHENQQYPQRVLDTRFHGVIGWKLGRPPVKGMHTCFGHH